MKNTKPNISKQISIDTVNDACDKNYQVIMLKYYQLQFGWFHNAYNSFKDIDKYIILAYLINKTLATYNKHFYNLSFDEFYSNKSVDIEKISISDLVKDINLSKETARRKLNEMTNDGIITRNKKKITKGIITDGQIRRYNEKNSNLHAMKVSSIMTKNPISIEKNALAAKALSMMNAKKITSLCVHSDKNKNKTIGVLHIHNILSSNIS